MTKTMSLLTPSSLRHVGCEYPEQQQKQHKGKQKKASLYIVDKHEESKSNIPADIGGRVDVKRQKTSEKENMIVALCAIVKGKSDSVEMIIDDGGGSGGGGDDG